jgi:hypothetical protein
MRNSRKVLTKTFLVLEGLRELTYTFMYVAILDDLTCQACLKYDKRVMSGEEAERTFPYLTKGPNDWVWYPNIHPHCRCILILLEAGF